MGLTSSLNTAISGLNSTQIGIGIVSQNVANAGTAGYVRRTVSTAEVNGGGVIGTTSTQVQRMLDQIVQRQLWQESAGAAYTSTRAEAFTTLDQLFGAPGSSNAFDAVYTAFTNSLQALENDPSSYSNRTAVLDSAKELALRLNSLSDGIQQLRSQAEAGLANGVTSVNTLLDRLSSLNAKVVQAGKGDAAASLRDERDRVLSDLSQYVDIRTTENEQGSLSVFTNSGVQIFDGRPSVTFTFDQQSALSAGSQWTASAATRGVGTISMRDGGGNVSDAIANNTFRSGEIGAYIELRDKSLVQAQAQIDEIAAHLASALSDREIKGTVNTTGTSVDLNTLGTFNTGAPPEVFARGNTVSLDYKASATGATQRITFVNASNGTIPTSAQGDANNRVIAVDMSGTAATVAANLQAALDIATGTGTFTVGTAGNTMTLATGTAQVVGLTARPTATGLTGSAELPLFVDGNSNKLYTGSFEGAQQFTGFAGRISLNTSLISDRSKLVDYTGSTAQGDSTRPSLLLDRLNSTQASFTRALGVDGSTATSTTTVSSYVQRVVASQGQSIDAAKRLDEGQQIALAAVQGRFSEASKVSVDQEMSLLIELQSAYAANARIVSTVKEMMDVLMRI